MAYELTWSFNINTTYTPASTLDASRYCAWWIASSLIGGTAGFAGNAGKWTLFASSDSSTAGIDSTDRWLLNGTYDGTKIVRAASGAHSWVILKSPTLNGSNWYLTFDFLSNADANWIVMMSKAAPTGGSTSLRPTATDEWGVPSAGATAMVNNTHGTAVERMNMALSSRGDFWAAYVRNGATTCEMFMFVHAPTGASALDQIPIIAIKAAATTGNPATSLLVGTTGNGSRHWSNSAVATTIVLMCSNAGTTGVDALENKYLLFPLHFIAYVSAVSSAYRGRVHDYGAQSAATIGSAQGTTILDGGNIAWCLVGNLFVPANAALNFA